MYGKKEKAWKIVCRNWECGVLLPVAEQKLADFNGVTEGVVKKEDGGKANGEDSETESEDEAFPNGTVQSKRKKVEADDSETESEGETETKGKRPRSDDLVGIEVFKDLVEPPFEIPGAEYDGKQPWYFLEQHQR